MNLGLGGVLLGAAYYVASLNETLKLVKKELMRIVILPTILC